jgi:hypothetical protein
VGGGPHQRVNFIKVCFDISGDAIHLSYGDFNGHENYPPFIPI